MSLEEAMLEVVFFWFAFASAVGRQLQSLEPVPVPSKINSQTQNIKIRLVGQSHSGFWCWCL